MRLTATAVVVLMVICGACSDGDKASTSTTSPASPDAASASDQSGSPVVAEDPRCDEARTLVAQRLSSAWNSTVASPEFADTRAIALSGFLDLWSLAVTEMEKYDCAYESQFADFVNAIDRLNPEGFLADEQIAQVGAALAILAGEDPSSPSAVPSDADTSDASENSGGLDPGQTAQLRFFDVTVNTERILRGRWAVNVTVCYSHQHRDANSDGTTRVSTDPWSFLTKSGTEVEADPAAHSGLSPVYGEALVVVGECRTGWITSAEAAGRPAGVQYAPRDFSELVQWAWQP